VAVRGVLKGNCGCPRVVTHSAMKRRRLPSSCSDRKPHSRSASLLSEELLWLDVSVEDCYYHPALLTGGWAQRERRERERRSFFAPSVSTSHFIWCCYIFLFHFFALLQIDWKKLREVPAARTSVQETWLSPE